jgi:hypothetical protein
MKWTLVDSQGLIVVLRHLANGRVTHALERLQEGSHGLTQALAWHTDHHTHGACRPPESLKALFFPQRELFGSWKAASEPVLWPRHDKYSCSRHFGGSAKWS